MDSFFLGWLRWVMPTSSNDQLVSRAALDDVDDIVPPPTTTASALTPTTPPLAATAEPAPKQYLDPAWPAPPSIIPRVLETAASSADRKRKERSESERGVPHGQHDTDAVTLVGETAIYRQQPVADTLRNERDASAGVANTDAEWTAPSCDLPHSHPSPPRQGAAALFQQSSLLGHHATNAAPLLSSPIERAPLVHTDDCEAGPMANRGSAPHPCPCTSNAIASIDESYVMFDSAATVTNDGWGDFVRLTTAQLTEIRATTLQNSLPWEIVAEAAKVSSAAM